MDISQIALALGSSLTAGLNLYLTVLALGLLNRFEIMDLPGSMEIMSHPWVLAVAGILFLVEFVADKVPYIDSAWDGVHSFIRIPAGAMLAVGAMSDLPAHWIWIAALAGGFVSFSSHGAKASARLAVNSTPEPFSNWFLSVLEDLVSLGLLFLVSNHPYIAVAVALVLLFCFVSVILLLYKFFKMILGKKRVPQAGSP